MKKEKLFQLGIIALFFFCSCVKKEFSDNVQMNQIFSVPLGQKEVSLAQPDPRLSSSIPGSFGIFYFNDLPYSSGAYFFRHETGFDFNLETSKNKISWISRVDLKIRFENGFPTTSYLQIYQMDQNFIILDSTFTEGMQPVGESKIDAQGQVETPNYIILEVPYENDRLERLKQTRYIVYQLYVRTQREDLVPPRLSGKNKLKVNLAMRLYLNYKLNQL